MLPFKNKKSCLKWNLDNRCGARMREKIRSFLSLFIFLFILISYVSSGSAKKLVAESVKSANAVAWSKDGKNFAAEINGWVNVWNVSESFFNSENVKPSFIIGIDGNLKAISSDEIGTSSPQNLSVVSMKFSDDGRWLLVVWDNDTVSVTSLDDSQYSTSISGTDSNLPVKAAAFFDSSYSIIIPLDGKNLYEYFRLMATNQFMMRRNVEFHSPISSIDTTKNATRFIIASEDGFVNILDSRTWEVEQRFPRFTQKNVKPLFSPDGRFFLNAATANSLNIVSLIDYSVTSVLKDSGNFANAAVFSPKGRMIAAGLESGKLKVFRVKDGKVIWNKKVSEEKTKNPSENVIVRSLAYSPDGKYLLSGLSDGRVEIWDVSSLVKYDEISDEKLSELDALTPENSITVALAMSSVPESYYSMAENIDVSYRNYFRYPGYWFAGGGVGRGNPNGDFPYSYQSGGNSLAAPSVYSQYGYGGAGLVYNNIEYGFSLFSEFSLGYAMRILYNNSFSYAHFGKLYPSVFADVSVGASWKWVRGSFALQYDTNWDFLLRGSIGLSIPISVMKKEK